MKKDIVLGERTYSMFDPIGTVLSTTFNPKLTEQTSATFEFVLIGRTLVFEFVANPSRADCSYAWYTLKYPDGVGVSFAARLLEEREHV